MDGLQIGLDGRAPRPLAAIGHIAGNLQQHFTRRAGELHSNLSADMAARSAEFATARQAEHGQQQAAAMAQGAVTIHFNPTINAPGGDVAQIQTALQMSLRDFEQLFERLMADRQRRAY